MGIMGTGVSQVTPTATIQSKNIDKELERDRKSKASIIKLLLLGAAETGKSTFVRQIRILHHNGFTDGERLDFRDIIRDNVLLYTRQVLEAMDELNIAILDRQLKKFAPIFFNIMQQIGRKDSIFHIYCNELEKLYRDPSFLLCLERGQEYHLGDSATYLFSSWKRISSEDYKPSDQDILCARLPTSGIIEITFPYKRYQLCLVDVGGQKSQRRKWIHCFSDVTAVLFTVAMSFYDQQMEDDTATNRLHESIELFETICGDQHFVSSAFILFLNKKDIFREKLKKTPLCACFPEYKGKNTYEEASKYIRLKIESKSNRQDVYPHFTNATDTDNIDKVFNSAMAFILNNNLKETGFI